MNLSFQNYEWVQSASDERDILTLVQKKGYSDFLARILAQKGFNIDTVEAFINPKLRNLLPDPLCLHDMDQAVKRTVQALKQSEKIVAYGDYDVDGATATALLRRYFRDINYPIDLYIPDRLAEGYGANTQALLKLRKNGTHLVIMVDCGTTAFDALEAAKNEGLDVIILDHHMSEVKLPKAYAIVNPNRLDHPPIHPDLYNVCAAGMTFLFLIALQSKLKEMEWFEASSIIPPNLLLYLDLVALGTVCDVMPLTGLNRAFVKQGLKVMAQGNHIGFEALSEVSGLYSPPSCYHLGYVLGPRINAGGRVGESHLGSCLLTSEDRQEALSIAQALNAYNKERQDIEHKVVDHAHTLIARDNLDKNPVIMVAHPNWHPGVIGIVASRIKDIYKKPTCIVSFESKDGKGSGRSTQGVHLGNLMHQAVQKGLLTKGGGHAMAAGFTVPSTSYDIFYEFLNNTIPHSQAPHSMCLTFHSFLSLSEATNYCIHEMKALEPFGHGNPSPHFVILRVHVTSMNTFGNGHIRGQLRDEAKQTLSFVGFRLEGSELHQHLRDGVIDVLGTLKRDEWKGITKAVLTLEDARHASPYST